MKYLKCDNCGKLHQDTPDFVMCDCGRVAIRMEWATHKEEKTPAPVNLLPEIDQAAYEQIRAHARKLYLKAQRGYRAQQVTVYDNHDYWVMVATREFFNNLSKTYS